MQQAGAPERFVEQGVGGDDGGDGGRGTAAEAGRQGDALVDPGLEAEGQRESAAHGVEGHAGGIVLERERQGRLGAGDCGDADDRLGQAAHRDAVAERADGVAEHVEADGDVADRGGGEGAGDGRWVHARWAPSEEQTRRRSAKTPAAVTAGPAPGPCTTRGFSR